MEKNQTIEEFCAPCMALPMAFAGTGGAYSATNNWIFWGSVILTVISVGVYFYYKKNKCSTC